MLSEFIFVFLSMIFNSKFITIFALICFNFYFLFGFLRDLNILHIEFSFKNFLIKFNNFRVVLFVIIGVKFFVNNIITLLLPKKGDIIFVIVKSYRHW